MEQVGQERKWLIRLRGSETQESVSKRAQIHRAHYSHIEKGSRNPSVDTAKKIAAALGFNWIIFFENDCVEMTNKSA